MRKQLMSAAALILVATSGGLATAGEAAAADARPAAAASPEVLVKINGLVTGSMSAFQHSRKIREWENKGIDWSSDGCSWAPDKPSGFNFLPACQRHDFGYRNFKKQHIFNQKYKKRIDLRFAQDMFDVCNKYSGARKTLCESFAVTYYKAVSKAGS